MSDLILSRRFDSDAGPITLKIERPEPWPMPAVDTDPDNPPWRCYYTLRFPGEDSRRRYSVGIDSLQALLLALESAWGRLRHVGDGTPAERPPVRWLGGDDLGFTLRDLAAEI